MLPKLGRRGFLKVLGAAPVAAPLALKKASEDYVSNISNMGSLEAVNGCAPCAPTPHRETTVKFRQALALGFKKRIEAVIYEEERHVGYIDHDIAVMKSISLSAKIAYQRKRNVQKRIVCLESGVYNWDRLDSMLDDLLKLGL